MPKETWGAKVLYFGEDPRYLQEFISYCKINKPELNFQSCYHYFNEEEELSASINSIYKFLPHVILLDFSGKSNKALLKMSTFLSKHYPLRKIPTIALIKDLKDNKALINQILLSGIHFIQRKAPEFYNLGYYLKCLLTQFTGERIKAPHYFKVPFNKNVKVETIMRVSNLEEKTIHIETNFPFSPEHRVALDTKFENQDSKVFLKPIRRIREDLRYSFDQSYDMEFIWDLDEAAAENPNFVKSLTPMINSEELLYEKVMLPFTKKRYEKYIQSKQPLIFEKKKTKVLIFDNKLGIIDQKDRDLNAYPYDFILHAHLDSKYLLVPEAKADIITISYDDEREKDEKSQGPRIKKKSNNLEVIKNVIKRVNSMKGYSPFIIIYDYSGDPYALQELDYPKLIIKDSPFNLARLLDLCSVYERKEKLVKAKSEKKPKKIFLNGKYNDSIAHLNWDISLQYVSETHIKFSSPLPIPNLTVLSLDFPPKLYVTVVEKKSIQEYSLADENEYIGIIHGPGEKEKNQLRKLLNEQYKAISSPPPELTL
tara:strand:+ start:153 stop:1772 length:1620 start_codon:yes stop_codon:yes gene_type:complete